MGRQKQPVHEYFQNSTVRNVVVGRVYRTSSSPSNYEPPSISQDQQHHDLVVLLIFAILIIIKKATKQTN